MFFKGINFELRQDNNFRHEPFLSLQQRYEDEFSPITGYKKNAQGLYDQAELISHWSKKGVEIYILYGNSQPCGFCVVNLSSMINDLDIWTRDIAEFYVIPEYRKYGVGRWMAQEVFLKYKGKWEVRQLPGLEVRRFWVKVISAFTKGIYQDIDINVPMWQGSVQKFFCM